MESFFFFKVVILIKNTFRKSEAKVQKKKMGKVITWFNDKLYHEVNYTVDKNMNAYAYILPGNMYN